MEFLKKYGIFLLIVFLLLAFLSPATDFILIGGICSGYAAHSFFFLRRIEKEGIVATGEISGYEPDSDGDKTPLVSFKSLSGESINSKPFIYVSTSLSIFFSKKTGTKINVIYDPKDPKKFIFKKDDGSAYFFIFILFVAGMFFATAGVCNLVGIISIF